MKSVYRIVPEGAKFKVQLRHTRLLARLILLLGAMERESFFCWDTIGQIVDANWMGMATVGETGFEAYLFSTRQAAQKFIDTGKFNE